MKTKICKGYNKIICCNEVKPLSDFVKCKSALDGYRNWCKECYRDYKNKDKPKKEELPEGFIRCSNPECNEVKPSSEFRKNRRKCKDGTKIIRNMLNNIKKTTKKEYVKM